MDEIAERDAVISAANVLMVALLKMNRVIIPAFLKWRRAARLRGIQKADRDIQRMAAGDKKMQAMNLRQSTMTENQGAGCQTGGSTTSKEDSQLAHNLNTQRGAQMPRSGADDERIAPKTSSAGAGESDTSRSDEIQPVNIRSEQGMVERSAANENEYHTRHVESLQQQRAEEVHLFVYTSFVTIIITIVSIVVYGGIIIALVLGLFPFRRGQSIIFSFSLVATALISESEVLLQRKKKGEKDPNDLSRNRYKTNAEKTKTSTTERSSRSREVKREDMEDFSDLDV